MKNVKIIPCEEIRKKRAQDYAKIRQMMNNEQKNLYGHISTLTTKGAAIALERQYA